MDTRPDSLAERKQESSRISTINIKTLVESLKEKGSNPFPCRPKENEMHVLIKRNAPPNKNEVWVWYYVGFPCFIALHPFSFLSSNLYRSLHQLEDGEISLLGKSNDTIRAQCNSFIKSVKIGLAAQQLFRRDENIINNVVVKKEGQEATDFWKRRGNDSLFVWRKEEDENNTKVFATRRDLAQRFLVPNSSTLFSLQPGEYNRQPNNESADNEQNKACDAAEAFLRSLLPKQLNPLLTLQIEDEEKTSVNNLFGNKIMDSISNMGKLIDGEYNRVTNELLKIKKELIRQGKLKEFKNNNFQQMLTFISRIREKANPEWDKILEESTKIIDCRNQFIGLVEELRKTPLKQHIENIHKKANALNTAIEQLPPEIRNKAKWWMPIILIAIVSAGIAAGIAFPFVGLSGAIAAGVISGGSFGLFAKHKGIGDSWSPSLQLYSKGVVATAESKAESFKSS